MSATPRPPAPFQRNALAPSLIAAAALFLAPVAMGFDQFLIVRFIVAILGAIVAWFALQARQWWWTIVFVAIVVIWNPVSPLPFEGPVWTAAQVAAAIVFLIAGALIRVPRTVRP